MNDLTSAVKELIDKLNDQKELELKELAELFRKYPDGFEFCCPEQSRILSAYIGGIEINDIQIWYRCEVAGWTSEGEATPLREDVIDRAVGKFSVEAV